MRMLDSIIPANLFAKHTADIMTVAERDAAIGAAVAALPSADAYLGYVDGAWPTFEALAARFGGTAYLLDTAVFQADDATGSDSEPGDMTTAQQVTWAGRQLARGVWRPVCYRSISGMPELIGALAAAGITRAQVRLLSAHYGAGKHICGGMDGTQWTDQAQGAGGTLVDESLLADDFFGGPSGPPVPVTQVPTEDGMAMIEAGPQAETSISLVGGSAKGIEFGCDAARTGNNAPWLRVAAKPNSKTAWQVDRVQVGPSGKQGVAFTATDVGLISVVRDNGGAADNVPVSYNLY